MIMDEISSLSMKIYGSLMRALTGEKLRELEEVVFITGSVVQKELSSFRALFKGYREMIGSVEKEVFLKYIK